MRANALLTAIVLLACASSASGQSIGLYADAEGTNCAINVPVGSTGTFYVVFQPGADVPTIKGGLYQISFPNGYTVQVAAAPIVTSSSPVPGGRSFTLSGCHGNAPVLLFTLTITNLADDLGWRPLETRAVLTLCDATSRVATPKQSSLNFVPGAVATNPRPVDQATGVSSHTILQWTGGEGSHPCNGPISGISEVYLGTTNDPPLRGTTSESRIDLPLSGGTTYYWRVETITLPAGTRVVGPTWQFTTIPATRWCAGVCTEPSDCPGGCILGQCVLGAAANVSQEEPCPLGGSTINYGSMNRVLGQVSASSGACFKGSPYSSSVAVDRFQLVGPATPNPIAFQVVFAAGGTGSAHVRVDEDDASDFFQFGSTTLRITVERRVGEPFEVEYGVVGSSISQTGSGSASGGLRFESVPPGYGLVSCHGYSTAIAVQPVTWSFFKSRYKSLSR